MEGNDVSLEDERSNAIYASNIHNCSKSTHVYTHLHSTEDEAMEEVNAQHRNTSLGDTLLRILSKHMSSFPYLLIVLALIVYIV